MSSFGLQEGLKQMCNEFMHESCKLQPKPRHAYGTPWTSLARIWIAQIYFCKMLISKALFSRNEMFLSFTFL